MQQTADAVANVTKDQTVVDLEIILVSGSSYFFSSVAEITGVQDAAMAVMTAVSGLSYSFSSAAVTAGDSDAAAVDAMTATMTATNF